MRTLHWLAVPLIAVSMAACTYNNSSQIEVDEIKKVNAGLNNKIANLEKQIEKLKAAQAAEAAAKDAQTKTAKDNLQTARDLENQVGRATEYINSLRTEIATRDRQITKLKADLATMQAEIDRLRVARSAAP